MFYQELSADSMARLVSALNEFRLMHAPEEWVLVSVNNENHNWFAVLERRFG